MIGTCAAGHSDSIRSSVCIHLTKLSSQCGIVIPNVFLIFDLSSIEYAGRVAGVG